MVHGDDAHTITKTKETAQGVIFDHLKAVNEADGLESTNVLWVHVSEFLKATAMVKLTYQDNKSETVLFTLVYTTDGWMLATSCQQGQGI